MPAPYSWGDDDAEQAELGHAGDHVHVEAVRLVVGDGVRQDAIVDERAHRLLHVALLVGQLQVHVSAPRRGRCLQLDSASRFDQTCPRG
jgi:hypothetical protein